MASDALKHIILATILLTAFSFLMIFGAIQLGGNYDRDVSELEGSKFNLTGLNKTLQDAQETGEDLKNKFQTKSLFKITIGVITGIVEVAFLMVGFLVAPIVLFTQIMNDAIGIPPVITGVISFMFFVSVILAIWSVRKRGD